MPTTPTDVASGPDEGTRRGAEVVFLATNSRNIDENHPVLVIPDWSSGFEWSLPGIRNFQVKKMESHPEGPLSRSNGRVVQSYKKIYFVYATHAATVSHNDSWWFDVYKALLGFAPTASTVLMLHNCKVGRQGPHYIVHPLRDCNSPIRADEAI
ncbi:hypothetical protein HPB48_013375 [Haemaphysalis longicornis]|uniref:Uncharacterized protein n=1 Tax=Haemaphysalis longicornis TaxID=44386 RepID=A0A9J6FSN6_HAELO|nr:hypothetical protein HPB48_013375 [Haemaphysalis longicornis]